MKKFFGLLLCLFALAFFQGHAVAAEATKVGVVDLQEFQNKSVAFQKIRGKMQQNFVAMQKKLDDERNALMTLEEDLKKQSMMLSLDAQEDKKRELEKKRRYYKYLQDDFTQELKSTERETIKTIMKELQTIVKEIGDKEGYTLILERRTLGLIYYDEAVDITDPVTRAYDKMNQ